MTSPFPGNDQLPAMLSVHVQRLRRALVCGRQSIEELQLAGLKLERLARKATVSRDIEIVEQVAGAMFDTQLPRLNIAGLHYIGVSLTLHQRYEEAKSVLEAVVETGDLGYQARALLVLGAIYDRQGRTDLGLTLYGRAAQSGSADLLVVAHSQWRIANARVRDGSAAPALKSFERIEPLVQLLRSRYPTLYLDFLNDVAVALGEAGRVEEALRLSSIPASSPLVPSFPHWIETKRELEEKREATPVLVSISQSSDEALGSELETARAQVAAAQHAAAPASINEQAAEAESSELQVKARAKRAVLIALAWPFAKPANRAPEVFPDRSLAADDEPIGGVTRQWFSTSKSRAPPPIVTSRG